MDTKTYQIDKHKQLIPLNSNVVNFTCFFEVKSKDNKPFNLTIVEQGETNPKQYKLVENGYINGQIESDGQPKSYFLVLKAQQPCECDVKIVVKPKEKSEVIPPVPLPQQSELDPQFIHRDNMIMKSPETTFFQLKYILGISVALIIIYLIYRYRKPIINSFNVKKDILIPSTSSF